MDTNAKDASCCACAFHMSTKTVFHLMSRKFRGYRRCERGRFAIRVSAQESFVPRQTRLVSYEDTRGRSHTRTPVGDLIRGHRWALHCSRSCRTVHLWRLFGRLLCRRPVDLASRVVVSLPTKTKHQSHTEPITQSHADLGIMHKCRVYDLPNVHTTSNIGSGKKKWLEALHHQNIVLECWEPFVKFKD